MAVKLQQRIQLIQQIQQGSSQKWGQQASAAVQQLTVPAAFDAGIKQGEHPNHGSSSCSSGNVAPPKHGDHRMKLGCSSHKNNNSRLPQLQLPPSTPLGPAPGWPQLPQLQLPPSSRLGPCPRTASRGGRGRCVGETASVDTVKEWEHPAPSAPSPWAETAGSSQCHNWQRERALPYSSGAAGQVRGRGRAGRGEGTEQRVATSFFRICVPEPVVTSLPLVRSLSWGRGEFKCVYREVTMR